MEYFYSPLANFLVFSTAYVGHLLYKEYRHLKATQCRFHESLEEARNHRRHICAMLKPVVKLAYDEGGDFDEYFKDFTWELNNPDEGFTHTQALCNKLIEKLSSCEKSQ